MSAFGCLNCGAALTGPYCAQCGQRHREATDRTLRGIASEAFQALTSFDSRVWRSLVGLLTRPGVPTLDHIEGRRARQLGPVSGFLLASVLFFLVVPMPAELDADALRDPALVAQGDALPDWLAARIAARGETRDAFAERYARRAPELKKALTILLAPTIALPLLLLFWRRDRLVADHVVFAFHLTTVAMLAYVLFDLARRAAVHRADGVATVGGGIASVVSLILWLGVFVYLAVAVRRVYGPRPLYAALGAVVLFTVLGISAAVFEAGRDLATLWWLS